MKYRIRPATEEDALAMAELEKECFSEPWSHKALLDEMQRDNTRFFAAQGENGDIIGYARMLLALDEGQIINIAVTEKARGQGVGYALMQALEAEAVRCDVREMQLEVRLSGIAAQRLYEKMQFTVVGKRKNFYRFPTEDAVLMNKTLKD